MAEWTNHLDDHERERIEDQPARTFAALARKALFAGLLKVVNDDRRRRNLPALRRPVGATSEWEQTLNEKIDGAIMALDRMAGSPGAQGVALVQARFATLKQQVVGVFTRHTEE
jgi:hypothetical protein